MQEPVSGKDLLEIFREQALRFGAVCEEVQVVGVKLDAEVKEVYGLHTIYKGKTVILASGSVARKPVIPGEAEFAGKGVSYCATCDAAFLKGQRVCVIGDSDEALREAEYLAGFAGTVYLIVPSEEPKLPGRSPPIHLVGQSRLVAVEGTDVVTGVRVRNSECGIEQQMPMDGVFICLYGTLPSVDYLDPSVALGDKACVITHQTTETSIPGVYAAGDVTCSEVRQVVVSAAQGCIAALEAEKYIHHRKRSRYDWAKH